MLSKDFQVPGVTRKNGTHTQLKGEDSKMFNFKFHLPRLFILLLLLTSSGWVQSDISFSQVFVFGDSLSDTGNLASLRGDFPQPYFMNRASNGPLAVEILANQFGHTAEASLHLISSATGTNYAIIGANAAGTEPIDLDTQIINFQANYLTAPADALYVIFIGGNDIRDARNETNPARARSMVKAAAANVQQVIKSLSRFGARSFLLVNAPNVGKMPETRDISATTKNPELIENARKLSELYQNELSKKARYFKNNPRINITEFNLFKFFDNLIENADQYGISNNTDACYSSVNFTFHPDCNFDQFIFFDEIHPTARVHALVGNALYNALKEKNKEEEKNHWFRRYLFNFTNSFYP